MNIRTVKMGLLYLCCLCVFWEASYVFAAIAPNPIIQADLKTLFTNPPEVNGYPYQDLLTTASDRYGLSLAYVLAVVRGESFFDPKAKSHKGALGLMQVMPSTASEYGVTSQDLIDPAKNIDVGVHYLSDLYAQLKDPYLALAAYYCGPGGVDVENFTLREDCNEYVHYIHAHLKKILSGAGKKAPGTTGTKQHFVLTRFDNFLDAEQFLSFLSNKLSNLELDIFRDEVVRSDHVRYQYKIMAAYEKTDGKDEICSSVEKATGFSFCN